MEQKPTFANLRYMKRWYDFYYQRVVIRQRPVDESQEGKSQRPVDLSETPKKEGQIGILQRVVEELEIPQRRYLVVELKAVKFLPEHAGKINFYVNAADELLKGEGDQPSIGLIICKSYDKTIVEWSLRGVETPLGVAAYQLQEVVDRTVAEVELKRKLEQQKNKEEEA